MWGGGGGGGAESVSLYNLSAYIRYTIEVSEQVRIRLYHKQQLDEITHLLPFRLHVGVLHHFRWPSRPANSGCDYHDYLYLSYKTPHTGPSSSL